jgi:hypothetical protein
MSINCKRLLRYLDMCLINGHKYIDTKPERSREELEKFEIMSDILKSLTKFESKLVSNLDVD